MLKFLRQKIAADNPVRIIYYRLVAFLAAMVYRYPSGNIKVIGVTGTKGKTTTCNLISSILMGAGNKVAMATTVNFRLGDDVWANRSKMTTQGRFYLQKFLRQAVDAGMDYAVLEVSSHAIAQHRLDGINVDCAVFTNLQDDHLEYHGSKEKYREAKGMLFKMLNVSKRKTGIQKASILNKDDKEFDYFDQFLADRKYTYGMKHAEITSTNIDSMAHGTVFKMHFTNKIMDVYMPLPGEFNVYNAMAAACVGAHFGISPQTIKTAIENAAAIPGRVESIKEGQKYSIIVDYAHTTESLENVCALFKPLTKGKLILLFGCTGGGRDKAKRAQMGKVADKYADTIILTDDDPYNEDRFGIIEDIAEGIKRKEGDKLWKILSRREAIRMALTLAKEGDTVLLAGKGGEEVQAVGDSLIEWSDRQVVKELLGKEGDNKCMAV